MLGCRINAQRSVTPTISCAALVLDSFAAAGDNNAAGYKCLTTLNSAIQLLTRVQAAASSVTPQACRHPHPVLGLDLQTYTQCNRWSSSRSTTTTSMSSSSSRTKMRPSDILPEHLPPATRAATLPNGSLSCFSGRTNNTFTLPNGSSMRCFSSRGWGRSRRRPAHLRVPEGWERLEELGLLQATKARKEGKVKCTASVALTDIYALNIRQQVRCRSHVFWYRMLLFVSPDSSVGSNGSAGNII
jgi:hypothetical protein